MTNEQVAFTAKASNEPTILRSRHHSSTNYGGGMRTKSVADYTLTSINLPAV